MSQENREQKLRNNFNLVWTTWPSCYRGCPSEIGINLGLIQFIVVIIIRSDEENREQKLSMLGFAEKIWQL